MVLGTVSKLNKSGVPEFTEVFQVFEWVVANDLAGCAILKSVIMTPYFVTHIVYSKHGHNLVSVFQSCDLHHIVRDVEK